MAPGMPVALKPLFGTLKRSAPSNTFNYWISSPNRRWYSLLLRGASRGCVYRELDSAISVMKSIGGILAQRANGVCVPIIGSGNCVRLCIGELHQDGALVEDAEYRAQNAREDTVRGIRPAERLRAKIDLAYALEIFNEEQHDDAQSIRKIRNNFAHTTKKLNFKTQLVIDNCKNLSTWDGVRVDFDKVFDEAIAALVAYLEKKSTGG